MTHKPSQSPPVQAERQADLDQAIEKNKEVAEDIKEAADDLLVVHEVLKKGLSDGAAPADVEQAVAHTGEIEKKLGESAETLEGVNEALERAARK